MLKIDNLLIFYENAIAVNEFSMEVKRGEIIGLFGSNSAGKTTLMSAISGLLIEKQLREKRKGGERITIYGSIYYQEEDITHFKPSVRVKKGIVLSRERHPIFPDSSIMENLKIAGFLVNRALWKRKIELVFSIFPVLAEMKSRKAGFLSGGEQQMLAVGMALVVDPQLLLLDEPLLGLSPHFQTVLIQAIKTLKKELDLTIVISEQFARPVMPIIDRGYIMENGILTLSGTGQSLMDNPDIKTAYFGV